MKILIALSFAFCGFYISSIAQEAQKTEQKRYATQSIPENQNIHLDGTINESAWKLVNWATGFTVHHPNNGQSPKRQTKFKILYDEKNLYVGYFCPHENPNKIENRLGRRDNFPGDWVEINIDSYFDKNTAFSFTTSASGVKGDEFVTNNGNNWDSNWNPIWYVSTNVGDDGWTAEIKIPLSQLRFGNKEEQVWGFNVMRRDFGADERSTWQWIPQTSSGWVSNFGELHGIKGVKPQKQLEIQPYVVTSLETFEKEDGNPFLDGSDINFSVGLDGKIGITNDLTLDFNINPDFGQVEADPSQVNLNGFQVFFSERRPFFIENNNLFSFPLSRVDAGGPFWSDDLFYSRRIGAAPRGEIDLPDEANSETPQFTSILGSAKFSGKTKKGWSVGILESITAEEKANIDINGDRSSQVVEPLTNYFVGRLSKDINGGATIIGGTLTSANRKLSGTGLENQYHKEAYSGGANVLHTWKDREWQLAGNFVFSRVQGTNERITETQESFEHYFQRPDANHLEVDTTATSLSGNGGNVSITNYGGADNFSFQGGVTWRSPGLEINDLGFMNTADEINHYFWAGYRFPNPFSIFRSLRLNYNHYVRWNYDGNNLYNALNTNIHAQFKNYWAAGIGGTFELKDISQRALFGGPLLRQNRGVGTRLYINSDNRKKVTYGFDLFRFFPFGQDKGALKVYNIGINLNAQLTNALRLSITPSYFRQDRAIQNIDAQSYNGNERYITGRVLQETLSASIRINYSLTPNLTIEYWGQPFISKGIYTELKYITDPLAVAYQDRFALYDENQLFFNSENSKYLIDEDRDGTTDYSFEDPDFNFLQFRSNMVMRWEYIPGSEFFLVWSQSTTSDGDLNKSIISSIRNDLFNESINNIFLLKWTYRFH